MDLAEIRRLIIIALFSDDELMEKFVLKGGNALSLVHGIGERSSVDIDLSIPDDFADPEDVGGRIRRALEGRFDAAGLKVFDFKFSRKPSRLKAGQSPRWGGYLAEFKLIGRERFDAGGLAAAQRSALLVGSGQERVFKIDISKFEFCEAKEEAELDHFTIYVYSLPMVAIEKLRAICQQLPEYPPRPYSKARARDFYDIHAAVTAGALDLAAPENVELLRHIFAAKDVPLSLLAKIEGARDFHAVDWPAVRQATSGALEDFDFYFDFVVGVVRRLQALGVV
jgi:hypothetical protein